MKTAIIVASDSTGCIGAGGRLPWHYPEDLKWFKETTTGFPVIMGRKTFESIGRPLPNRYNIIVSRNADWGPSAEQSTLKPKTYLYVVLNVKEGIELSQQVSDRCFIIGGSEIYKAALPFADEIYLTKIPGEHQGDAFFPIWPLENHGWRPRNLIARQTIESLEFWIYERVADDHRLPAGSIPEVCGGS